MLRRAGHRILSFSKEEVFKCGCARVPTRTAAGGPSWMPLTAELQKSPEHDLENLPVEQRSVAKGLLLNRVDAKALTFPEFVETEDVNALMESVSKIEDFFDIVKSVDIDKYREIPPAVLDGLKQIGAYGMQVPQKYGGLGLNHKEYARVSEVLSRDLSVYANLSVHNDMVVWVISNYGTEDQKAKYLSKLASGELTAAFCWHEKHCGTDAAKNKTSASVVAQDQKRIVIDGEKNWVTNGDKADLLLVFAKVYETGKAQTTDALPYTTAFLVERNAANKDKIVTLAREETIGLRGAEFCDVRLDSVQVSSSAIVGDRGRGFELGLKAIAANRYSFGAAVVGLLKRLLGEISGHCNAVIRNEQPLSETSSIRRRVAEVALNTFALESMVYYIAGNLDESPHKEMDLEGAIVNRFAKQILFNSLSSAMEIRGASAYCEDSSLYRIFRDAITLRSFFKSVDVLTDQISLVGITAWAKEYSVDIPKYRDRTSNYWFSLKKQLSRLDLNSPKLTHFLNENVHPSLESECRSLEESMWKYDAVLTKLLEQYGKTIEDESFILERLCDSLVNLFAVFTIIARTSRTYSIGLRNSDVEMVWASASCVEMHRKVNDAMNALNDEEKLTEIEDKLMQKVAEAVFQQRGYQLECPLQRNW